MRIGRLRNKITFLAHGGALDGQGGYTDDAASTDEWVEVCSVWGECVPLSGRELYYAQQALPTVSHRLTVRYRSDINATMRVRVDGRLLDINAAMDTDSRHKELKILCTEVFPA